MLDYTLNFHTNLVNLDELPIDLIYEVLIKHLILAKLLELILFFCLWRKDYTDENIFGFLKEL